ncbi:MAG TPA: LysM peptidoglycan-binding domain-containing protein [Chthoniobacteraceae bacterium]|jgi:LysM repeat protein|nr:LysM peptidoglycan-binding domain-containing protein [Chthoniobacteraceae bacterium]
MKLPLRRSPKKKTLQAATVRRAREADYTEEPNVKLSSAFVVVLLLHLVAVGGIYAFNALKSRQNSSFEEADSAAQATPAQSAAAADAQSTPAPTAAAAPAPTHLYRVRSGDTIARIALAHDVNADEIINMNASIRAEGGIHVGEELTLPGGAASSTPAPAADDAAPHTVALRDSGTTYTVMHGDTLVSIARKLHVGFDDLMRLNKIEDPRKLKIGLKLKVPARRPTTTA